ncbi:MAG: hypothetical protein ACRDTD_14375 [Pseudonocardiaceae bacterium]
MAERGLPQAGLVEHRNVGAGRFPGGSGEVGEQLAPGRCAVGEAAIQRADRLVQYSA